jgi:hypothetical protein
MVRKLTWTAAALGRAGGLAIATRSARTAAADEPGRRLLVHHDNATVDWPRFSAGSPRSWAPSSARAAHPRTCVLKTVSDQSIGTLRTMAELIRPGRK